MIVLFKKEVASFFNSFIGFIVIGVFLVLAGLVVWVFPDSNLFDYGFAELDVFFRFCPYIFLFIIPAITMRMFAEESRNGTLEFLLTKPVSLFDIILGKYFAALFIVFLALIPTLIYYFSVYKLGNPVGNIDSNAVVASYFGLLLLAATFVAIGVFTSSLTKNQVVAFIVGALLCYIFFDGIRQISGLFGGSVEYFIHYLGLDFHYDALGKGLFDSRNVIFLLSFSALFLYFTHISIDKQRR